MLIHYMATNQKEWPKQWEDLRKADNYVAKAGEDACTFNELQKRVWINFELSSDTINQLAQRQTNNQYTFIRLRSGRARRSMVWCRPE